MDVAMFRPAKDEWKKTTLDWRMKNNGERIGRPNFAPLLEKTLNNIDYKNNLQQGFRTCGLYPFSPDAINYTKLMHNSANDSTDSIESVENSDVRNLRSFEKQVDPGKLKEFEKSTDTWQGATEDLALFNVWLNWKIQCGERRKNNVSVETEKIIAPSTDPITHKTSDKREEIQNDQNTIQPVVLIEIVDLSEEATVTQQRSEHINSDESNVFEFPEWNSIENSQVLSDIDVNIPIVNATNNISCAVSNKNNNDSGPSLVPNASAVFKDVLFWPTKEMTMKKKSTKSNGKVPSVVSSHKWQEYHKAKEREKEILQEQKDERKRKREEKAQINLELKRQKQVIREEKKRKTAEQKKNSEEQKKLKRRQKKKKEEKSLEEDAGTLQSSQQMQQNDVQKEEEIEKSQEKQEKEERGKIHNFQISTKAIITREPENKNLKEPTSEQKLPKKIVGCKKKNGKLRPKMGKHLNPPLKLEKRYERTRNSD